jgi:Protein of unknown function (DUF3617)
MPRLPIAAAMLGLALGACSQQSDDAQSQAQAQASASAAAKAAAQAMRPEPGKYRITTKFTKVSMPGLPPAVAANAGKMFSDTGQSTEFCLTPEQASLGYEEMTKRAAQGKCTYERFSAAGGRLDAAMTCEMGKGMTTKSQVSGTFSPIGSNMTMVSDATVPGLPGGGMHMEGNVVTERLGDCS